MKEYIEIQSNGPGSSGNRTFIVAVIILGLIFFLVLGLMGGYLGFLRPQAETKAVEQTQSILVYAQATAAATLTEAAQSPALAELAPQAFTFTPTLATPASLASLAVTPTLDVTSTFLPAATHPQDTATVPVIVAMGEAQTATVAVLLTQAATAGQPTAVIPTAQPTNTPQPVVTTVPPTNTLPPAPTSTPLPLVSQTPLPTQEALATQPIPVAPTAETIVTEPAPTQAPLATQTVQPAEGTMVTQAPAPTQGSEVTQDVAPTRAIPALAATQTQAVPATQEAQPPVASTQTQFAVVENQPTSTTPPSVQPDIPSNTGGGSMAQVAPTALPRTGFAEEVGIPGLIGLAIASILVIFVVRRVRSSTS